MSNYGDFVDVSLPGFAQMPVGYQSDPGIYAGTSISTAFGANLIANFLMKKSRRLKISNHYLFKISRSRKDTIDNPILLFTCSFSEHVNRLQNTDFAIGIGIAPRRNIARKRVVQYFQCDGSVVRAEPEVVIQIA